MAIYSWCDPSLRRDYFLPPGTSRPRTSPWRKMAETTASISSPGSSCAGRKFQEPHLRDIAMKTDWSIRPCSAACGSLER